MIHVLMMLATLAAAPPRSAQSPVASAQETAGHRAPGAGHSPYEVFAIRYGTVPAFKVSGLIDGADPSRRIDIAMMVWLIRGNGRNVLVDSGFYRETYIKSWKVQDFARPDEAVARAGVKADEITDVILTHAHWDHAGGANLFPKAQIWIQKDEYRYYTVDAWQPDGKHGGIEREDMDYLERANKEGRLHLVIPDSRGDREILPGIRVYTGGRHTYASQYVSVDAKAGTVVLASDNMYLYENLEKHVPIAQTFDAKSNLAAQDRMKTIASDPRLIVPGHDPAVMTRFPKIADGVVRIE
jgi:glyoxylase-like metal-dependent hydrolase (beta-lactamase superfamily II)